MSNPTGRENIVIIGGGIIGCTTAYYLTRHPCFDSSTHSITILEASRIANGASSKAGGLLASWAFPNSLAELSFDLHDQLAKEHNGADAWGYRRLKCSQLTPVEHRRTDNRNMNERSNSMYPLGKWSSGSQGRASVLPDDLDWFDAESVKGYEQLADTSSTAQVYPLQFTQSIAKLAEKGGARLIIGAVESINCSSLDDASGIPEPLNACVDLTKKKVVSVTYTDKITSEKYTIVADTVVLAAGPWSPTLFKMEMRSLRAHSVTIKLNRPVSAYCLFTNIAISESSESSAHSKISQNPLSYKHVTLEFYARPNNEVYICGPGDFDVPLSSPADAVEVSSERCQDIISAAISLSNELRNGLVTKRQACYLPIENVGSSSDPLVGKSDVQGLFLATRHSCWGISNAPATGKVISELILDGKVSCIDFWH